MCVLDRGRVYLFLEATMPVFSHHMSWNAVLPILAKEQQKYRFRPFLRRGRSEGRGKHSRNRETSVTRKFLKTFFF